MSGHAATLTDSRRFRAKSVRTSTIKPASERASANRASLSPNIADDRSPRCFQIGAIHVIVQSDVPGVMAEYLRLYQPSETRDSPPDTLRVRVTMGRSKWTGGRRFIIRGGDDQLFSVKRRAEILPHLEWAINWQVVRESRRHLQVHAGVVSKSGRALMMPASPQSGKTTLCAGLVARGWKFHSDEFALIDPDALTVQPYPKALCVKAGSFDIVKQLGWKLDARMRYKKGKKGRVAYVSFSDTPQRIAESEPVRWIVFPKYVPGQSPRLTPITRGEAVFELRRLSFNFDRFGNNGLKIMTRMMAGARAFRLASGPLGETCDLIDALTADDAEYRG